MQTQRIFFQTHAPIHFTFKQTIDDFIVDEIIKSSFSGKGNFLILRIQKKSLSTWELLTYISKVLDIKEHLIGYAGLKDKHATTTQYISIPIHKSKDYKLLNNKNIKVLQVFKHDKKLRIGDLFGNRFKIRLHDIQKETLPLIYQIISQIQKHGMPNYFGYQRFGKEENFEKSKRIVNGEEILADKKLEKFLKLAYQSYFFNGWLARRIEITKKEGNKKILPLSGDIFSRENTQSITGLLPGRGIIRAKDQARCIEEEFDDIFIHEKGYRRDAIVQVMDIENKYEEKTESLVLEFSLPKGSYATVFIENIANKQF